MVEVYFRPKRTDDDVWCEAYDCEKIKDAKEMFKKEYGNDFVIISCRNPMKEAIANYRIALRSYYETCQDWERVVRCAQELRDFGYSEDDIFDIDMSILLT